MEDSELVAAIIGSGSKKKNVHRLAREVVIKLREEIEKNGKLPDFEEVTSIQGVGPASAVKLLCSIELGKRLHSRFSEKVMILSSEDAYKYLRFICKKKQEHLMAIFLNARFEIVGKRLIAKGGHNYLSVQPRDILIPALEYNCTGIILGHNHPSGNLEPSKEDRVITEKIRKACKLVGFRLMDHIIISSSGWGVVDKRCE